MCDHDYDVVIGSCLRCFDCVDVIVWRLLGGIGFFYCVCVSTGVCLWMCGCCCLVVVVWLWLRLCGFGCVDLTIWLLYWVCGYGVVIDELMLGSCG